jgi:hypothetical protein
MCSAGCCVLWCKAFESTRKSSLSPLEARHTESRVVIASTGSRAPEFPSEHGGYLSDAFFTALGDNADLWTAHVAGVVRRRVDPTGGLATGGRCERE